jgi:hypothetical protein
MVSGVGTSTRIRHGRSVKLLGQRGQRYASPMTEDASTAEEPEEGRRLSKHLAALVGSLHGPADLGANHDAYLTYPGDRTESGGFGVILRDTGPVASCFK